MAKAFKAELKDLVRNLSESLTREERAMYLKTHSTSTSGYYPRDLLPLVEPMKDLEVPRVREGDFHPQTSGFGSLARKGKEPGVGKKFSRTSSDAWSNGCRSSSPTTSQT